MIQLLPNRPIVALNTPKPSQTLPACLEFNAIPVQLASIQFKCLSTRLYSSSFSSMCLNLAFRCQRMSRNCPNLQQMCRTHSRSYILLLSHLLLHQLVTNASQMFRNLSQCVLRRLKLAFTQLNRLQPIANASQLPTSKPELFRHHQALL